MARDQEARGQNRHPKRAETQSAQSSLQALHHSSAPGGGWAPARIFKFVKGCGELAQADRYWLPIPGREQLFLCPAAFKNYRMTRVRNSGSNFELPEGIQVRSLAEREKNGNMARKMRPTNHSALLLRDANVAKSPAT